ncbi:MAG: redoxin domain-containing protein [Candidatus Obscuribacterales bacterium]|nr:redoxin domain-containing protein [Candidatus Obscuribacterales bacterium]
MTNLDQFKTALILVLSSLSVSPVFAAGGATFTPGTDQHLDMQHQIGARTYTDCGRAAEADMRLPATGAVWKPSKEVRDLIGTAAPEFASDLQWVNCKPMSMAQLRGHPVFIRFWYRNCDMCVASAPLMNDLESKYAKDGLVVIGIHHAKTTKGDSLEEVAKAAADLGYKNPIAIDNSWNTIEKFWIHSAARAYSSASFLIDKNGIIVWGHDLGRLEKGTPASVSLHQEIDKLLAENK